MPCLSAYLLIGEQENNGFLGKILNSLNFYGSAWPNCKKIAFPRFSISMFSIVVPANRISNYNFSDANHDSRVTLTSASSITKKMQIWFGIYSSANRKDPYALQSYKWANHFQFIGRSCSLIQSSVSSSSLKSNGPSFYDSRSMV